MNNEKKGIFILLSASFFFALITLFNRFVPASVGTFYQLFLRTSIMSFMFLCMSLFFRDSSRIHKKDIPLLSFRGLLFVGDFASFFIAANHLPLGTTLFLFYAGSVITSYLYGFIFLYEKINTIKIISVCLAFIGLCIMYGKDFNLLITSASFFALFAGICFGLETATSKHVTTKYSVNQINFITYLTAALLSIVCIVFSQEHITYTLHLQDWIMFIGFAVVGVLAFYATILGYKYVEAQKASIILLSDALIVIPIGLIYYQEIPSLTTIIAGFFILSAVILPNITSFKK